MRRNKNKQKKEVLDKILDDGFTPTNLRYRPYCRVYECGKKRILYDEMWDRILTQYEIRSFEE